MKSTVPRLITLVVAAALALARFAAGAPPTADYELLFAEEFDGDRVNDKIGVSAPVSAPARASTA
jgi:hypothetical protein